VAYFPLRHEARSNIGDEEQVERVIEKVGAETAEDYSVRKNQQEAQD
jgi:hypothetical protein